MTDEEVTLTLLMGITIFFNLKNTCRKRQKFRFNSFVVIGVFWLFLIVKELMGVI